MDVLSKKTDVDLQMEWNTAAQCPLVRPPVPGPPMTSWRVSTAPFDEHSRVMIKTDGALAHHIKGMLQYVSEWAVWTGAVLRNVSFNSEKGEKTVFASTDYWHAHCRKSDIHNLWIGRRRPLSLCRL